MKSNITFDYWIPPEVPVECYKLIPISVYCVLLFILSTISNATLMLIFLKNKDLMNPVNLFVFVLAALNFIGTIIEIPLVTFSAITCRYLFIEF
jgi:hypothetical protein